MKFNNILLLIAATIFSCNVFAQRTAQEDAQMIALSVWIPDNDMPDAANIILENKIHQIATKQGMSADALSSRFVFTANVVEIEKTVTATAPPKQMEKLEVTFYIGDGIEGKMFASYSTSCTGIGDNATKAYINALKSIKTNNPKYQVFAQKGKERIIEYFNRQCDAIITEANSLAAQQNFDEALWKLSGVPNVCSECWNMCIAAAAPIFQKKIDLECQSLLAEATNIWNSGQDWNAANSTAEILSAINPQSKCFGEVTKLSKKISKRVKELNDREWKLKWDKEVTRQKAIINAYKEIGIARAKSQSVTVIYKTFW
jgi:hypothetical protein